MDFDAIVIGGSFAGLSAATQLARAKRKVLVIDSGKPRNRFAAASHGFLGQDGEAPHDILAKARRQLLAYPTASILDSAATAATRGDEGFSVATDGAPQVTGKRLILATGVVDRLPDVAGLEERWGRTVFHCPYCHGYELGDGPIAVLAVGAISMHQAMMLPDWAPTTFFTNEAFEPDPGERTALRARGVTLDPTPVADVADGDDGAILVRLRDGRQKSFAGLFVAARTEAAAPFAADLGCAFEDGPLGSAVKTDATKATSVEGVFACGDAARMAGNVPFAVADGAMAGVAAHRSLIFGMD
jgi:thioredoxin reductase